MPTNTNRLISLDAFRGFTLAAMVIVNDPGSWSHVYAPLLHAKWNGATPTDLIFPFFLFIIGVSIALAYTKLKERGADRSEMVKKIIWRSVKIYLLGMFLHLWPNFLYPEFDLSTIRWVGVLHRIAFVFLFCALLFLYTDWKRQLQIAAAFLIGYWLLMCYVPTPDGVSPDLSVPLKNWANWLDNKILPGSLYQKTWDPEGFLSTIPSFATGISGMLIGHIILTKEDLFKKISWIFFAGFGMFLLGAIWSWFFPVNKHIWTSSYVLHTSGLATMTLAFFMLLIDVWKYQKWTFLGRVYGANSITTYALHSMLTVVFYRGLNAKFMEAMSSIGMSMKMSSLLYALIYMLIIFIPAYILYKRKIYIKL